MAARRGIQTVSGVEMFVAQGAAQWTDSDWRTAPVAAMRRAVLRMLSSRIIPAVLATAVAGDLRNDPT